MKVMASQELIAEIRNTLRGLASVIEVRSDESAALIAELATRFIDDPSCIWWWQSLRSRSRTISYGDSDGLAILSSLIHKDENVYLVVTDDEPPPWSVFKGKFYDIYKVIGELPYFEYFVVSESKKWIVFDTHHNSLYIAGDIEGSKRSPDGA